MNDLSICLCKIKHRRVRINDLGMHIELENGEEVDVWMYSPDNAVMIGCAILKIMEKRGMSDE